MRGGRGGGRGGRGGARGAPWSNDPTMKADSKPVELFPEFSTPTAGPLTDRERRSVDCYLLVREQTHSGPLYTQTRSLKAGLGAEALSGGAGKAYGQDQINQRYGVRNKANVDPFTAVPMYSQRFQKEERALPDLAGRPFSRDLFPEELWPTLDGRDGRAGARGAVPGSKKVLALSDVTALRTADEIFNVPGTDADASKALAQLEKFKNVGLDNDENVEFALVEDDADYDEVEDEEYDDDEEGDYNAEAAFDNGDDDDYGDDHDDDGGGDEGMY